MPTNQFQIGDRVTIHTACCNQFDIFKRYVATHPGVITSVDRDLMGRVAVEFEMVAIRDGQLWIPLLYRVQPQCLKLWQGGTEG